ncbi:MAG: hypothetical protein Q8O83_03300 [bacterium]|nr:hypothetical protein [bacterium]
MKWIIGIFVVFILIIAGFFAYRTFFTAPQEPISNENVLFPISRNATPPPLPTSDTVTLITEKGTVTTKNFLKNAASIGSDVYSLTDPFATGDFGILYLRKNNSFLISIRTKPIDAARQEAEQEFLRLLGISRNEACNLLISVGAPGVIDPLQKEYGLSFCPDGIPF